jgi:hypothetical protein
VSYSIRRISWTTALALVLVLIAAAPAHADEVASHVRSVRSDLAMSAPADGVAGSSAAAMASAAALFHVDLSSLLGPCESVAEIVGTGPDVASVFTGFRNSAPHWSILTNPSWTAMGTGQATASNGSVYVSVVFCLESATSTEQPAPPPPPDLDKGDDRPAPQPEPPPVRQIKAEPPGSPVIRVALPAVGARRALIRARLDGQAQAALPAWYTGVCSNNDRSRALTGGGSNIGSCPSAA